MREKPKSKAALAREKFLRSNVKKQKAEKNENSSQSHTFNENNDQELVSDRTVPRHGDHGEETGTMDNSIVPGNRMFAEVLGEEILLVMREDQLNLFGQTFRPIFCGLVSEVTNGFITLDPVIIKMTNAPFHRFPTPLSFPMEQISTFTPFDCGRQIPLS